MNPNQNDRQRWNRRYSAASPTLDTSPVALLRENVHLLPRGKALDLAMGQGRNGVFLASCGFEVVGLDISENGLRKACQWAHACNTEIATKTVDLEQAKLEENEYDVVVMTYYLQRDLFPQIKIALKRGGMAIVETYHEGFLRHRPEFRREYLLRGHELLEVFDDFRIVVYQYRDDPQSACAGIMAQKP